MNVNCVSCGEPIHPKRLELVPGTKTCVPCTTTGRKIGKTITVGEGDHTYNDIVILEPDEKYSDYEDSKFDDELEDED